MSISSYAGCNHEFCTKCALYLCSTSTSSTSTSKRAPAGSIPCPFCRHPIVAFSRLTTTSPIKLLPWTNNSTLLGPTVRPFAGTLRLDHSVDLGCTSLRSVSFRKLKGPSICNNADSETAQCLVSCLRPDLQRSSSHRASVSRRSSSRFSSSS
jgi:E3 ubiquitin-protein ligase XBAT32/33